MEIKNKFNLGKVETARVEHVSGIGNGGTLNKSQANNEISFSSYRTRPAAELNKHHQLALHYPGYSFSKISRFESNIFEKFKSIFYSDLSPIFKSSSNKSREFRKERINKNKIMKNHSPEEKSMRLKTISDQGRSHRAQIRIRRDEIFKSVQANKQEKLLEKFRKFEIRHKKSVSPTQESATCKRCWSLLTLSIGMIFILRNAVEKKKNQRKKALNFLFILKSATNCGIIMLKIARRVKKKLALQKITRSVKSIRKWLAAVRKKNKSIIANSLNDMTLKNTFYSLLSTWKWKIIYIQKTMRKALSTRKSLITTLLAQWEFTEHFVLYQKHRSKSRRRKEKEFKSNFSIDTKISLIKEKIKELVFNYIMRVKNYQVVSKMNKGEDASMILKYNPAKPVSPDILMEFTPKVFEKLIGLSLKEQIKSRQLIKIE